MKFSFALIFAASFAALTGAQAQNSAPTATTGSADATSTATSAAPAPTSAPAGANADVLRQLASRLVALQRGPEMERTTFQLTSGAVQPLIDKWAPKLESLPKANAEKARDQLNAELKTLGETTRKLIEEQMNKSADEVLLPAYAERFTGAEMMQLVTLFESPAFKKYQAAAPGLGNIWVKHVVDQTREAVQENAKNFDAAAAKIIGNASPKAPAKAPAKSAPAAKN